MTKSISRLSNGRTSMRLPSPVGKIGDFRLDQRHAFVQAEQRPLARIGRDADHQSIHHLGGAVDDVPMPVGDRVEGPRINADGGRNHPLPLCSRHAVLLFLGGFAGAGFDLSVVGHLAIVLGSVLRSSAAVGFDIAQTGHRHHPLTLRHLEQRDALGLAAGDADIVHADPDQLSAVGHHHELIVIDHRERGDNFAVARGDVDGGDALYTPAHHPIFVG